MNNKSITNLRCCSIYMHSIYYLHVLPDRNIEAGVTSCQRSRHGKGSDRAVEGGISFCMVELQMQVVFGEWSCVSK